MGMNIWDWTDKWLPTAADGDKDEEVWIRRSRNYNVYFPKHWKDIGPGEYWCHTPYWWRDFQVNPDLILRLDTVRRRAIESALRDFIPRLLAEADEVRYFNSDRAHDYSLRWLGEAKAALGLMEAIYHHWRPTFSSGDGNQEVAA